MDRPAAPHALHMPPPLPLAELDDVLKALSPSLNLTIPDPREILLADPAGHTAAALAVEAIGTGVLTEPEAYRLLSVAAIRGHEDNRFRGRAGATRAAVLARDAMRVGMRVASWQTERDGGWPDEIVRALIGAHYTPTEPLRDESGLDSLAAVVAFAVKDDLARFTHVGSTGTGFHRMITNERLEDLLRECPHELHRITACLDAYDRDRILTMDDDDIALLREHLEATEETPAVADGWL